MYTTLKLCFQFHPIDGEVFLEVRPFLTMKERNSKKVRNLIIIASGKSGLRNIKVKVLEEQTASLPAVTHGQSFRVQCKVNPFGTYI